MTKDFGDQMLEQSDLHFAELNQDLHPCTIVLNDDTEIQGECEWVEPYQEDDRLECIHVYHLDGTRIPSDMYKRIVTLKPDNAKPITGKHVPEYDEDGNEVVYLDERDA